MTKLTNVVMTKALFIPGMPEFKNQLNQQQYPGIQMSYAVGGVRCIYKEYQFLVPFTRIEVIVEVELAKEGKKDVQETLKAA